MKTIKKEIKKKKKQVTKYSIEILEHSGLRIERVLFSQGLLHLNVYSALRYKQQKRATRNLHLPQVSLKRLKYK